MVTAPRRSLRTDTATAAAQPVLLDNVLPTVLSVLDEL